MAVNPITSDDLTIDLASLLSLSVSERVQAAASDPGFAQALMQALTPIQLAKAFPDYYRRELPDISNFILANRYLDSGGRFDQRGGGDYGKHKDMYSGGATLDNTARPLGVPTPTLEEMKAKLLEKGIDVDNIYKSVSAEGISIDDEKVKVLKNLSSDQLTKMGFEQFEDDSGKKKIRLLPTETASLSDEQIIKRAESRRLDPNKFMDPMTSGKLRPEIVSKYQGKRLPVSIRNNNMGAISLKDDSNTFVTGMPGYLDKTERPANEGGYYARYATPEHGVAAASRNLENYGKKGITSPAAIVKTWAEDGNQNYINTVVKYLNDAGYEVNQNSTLDLTDPKVRMAILKGKSAFESGAGMPVYTDEVFETGVNYTFESPIDPNKQYTPEEIKELRKKDEQYQISRRQDDAVRALYNLPSPTSSTIYEDSSEQFGVSANMEGVDPRLAEISRIAAEEFPLRVRLFSGKRDSGAHGRGLAIDTQLYDEAGVPIASYKTPQTANVYALWAEKMREVQQRLYPELNDEFVWGGSFSGLEGGKYGAADWMDFRIGRHNGVETENMQAYKFGQGFQNPNYVASAENDFLGIGNRPVTLDDLKLLEGFRLTKEQQDTQRQIALTGDPQGQFNAGLLAQPNIGERQLPAGTVVVATEQTASAPIETQTPETPTYQYGGTPDVQDDEDLTAVGSDGKPKFKFNSGEGLYVKPEANEYADDKIDELSNRLDKMSESQNQPQRKMSETQEPKSDPKWAEKVASAYRPSGTQQRAFNRAQFRSEGRHVGDRGSPNIA